MECVERLLHKPQLLFTLIDRKDDFTFFDDVSELCFGEVRHVDYPDVAFGRQLIVLCLERQLLELGVVHSTQV